MEVLLGQQLGGSSAAQGQVLNGTAVPCQVPEPGHWVSLTSGSPNTAPTASRMCPSSGGGLLMFPAVDILKTKALK